MRILCPFIRNIYFQWYVEDGIEKCREIWAGPSRVVFGIFTFIFQFLIPSLLSGTYISTRSELHYGLILYIQSSRKFFNTTSSTLQGMLTSKSSTRLDATTTAFKDNLAKGKKHIRWMRRRLNLMRDNVLLINELGHESAFCNIPPLNFMSLIFADKGFDI